MRHVKIVKMADIHILCISDIHYDNLSPENQGYIIKEFFEDLKDVLGKYDKESLYCIISGDLVQAGNAHVKFEKFHKGFIKKLTDFLDLSHILCVPGNHDLNRNVLDNAKWAEKQNALVNSTDEEEPYNNVLKTEEDSVIYKKFEFFDEYCRSNLMIDNYNLLGYTANITSEVSIYCLNSAILSNGGKENFPDDSRRLRVETSGLYQWATKNEGRTKILVMHHPLNQLTEYVEQRIQNLIDNEKLEAIVTGHLHQQNFKRYLGKEAKLVKYCSAPPLSIGKTQQNGYSILHFSGSSLASVEYRKWSTIHDKFVSGSDFSTTPSGIISFKKKFFTQDDIVTKSLTNQLQNSLYIYNYASTWVDRVLSNVAPGTRTTGETVDVWDHINVINSDENIQIVGGAQFGLTCFAHKMILEAWKIKGAHWIYFDGSSLRLSRIENELEKFCRERNISSSDINRVVIDNWNEVRDNGDKVLKKFQKCISSVKFVLLNSESDTDLFRGLNSSNYQNNFKLLYLRELSRKSIRQITCDFIKTNMAEEDDDKILERLIKELLELNVHRTPVNCLQILLNFKQSYDTHPADRTKMLKSLLQFFFLKPSSYFYTEDINEQDCCIIMGALCEYMMRKNDGKLYQQSFSEEEYYDATSQLDGRYTKELRKHLFDSMTEAQIIVSYLNNYTFRFNYWVYFFTAYQMYVSQEFYQYMVEEQKCIYMPDIVEFYTGIDEKCQDMVTLINKELVEKSQELSDKFGAIKDPYSLLKFRPNPKLDSLTRTQVEENIKASKLPANIKDALLDAGVDNTKPYMQTIETVMSEYRVKNLMSLCRSASRALRNSELINTELRGELFNSIQCGWDSVIKVLLILSKPLALTGYGKMGGASFTLTGDWPKEPEEKFISVIASIPFNIILWYRNDIYSARRKSIFEGSLLNSDNSVINRHLSALLLTASRPKGWHECLRKYIASLGKNSFYLADIDKMLRYTYRIEYMPDADLRNTRNLMLECWEKSKRTYSNPDTNRYYKTNTAGVSSMPVLPKRLV